jgi:hypothetical protein
VWVYGDRNMLRMLAAIAVHSSPWFISFSQVAAARSPASRSRCGIYTVQIVESLVSHAEILGPKRASWFTAKSQSHNLPRRCLVLEFDLANSILNVTGRSGSKLIPCKQNNKQHRHQAAATSSNNKQQQQATTTSNNNKQQATINISH